MKFPICYVLTVFAVQGIQVYASEESPIGDVPVVIKNLIDGLENLKNDIFAEMNQIQQPLFDTIYDTNTHVAVVRNLIDDEIEGVIKNTSNGEKCLAEEKTEIAKLKEDVGLEMAVCTDAAVEHLYEFHDFFDLLKHDTTIVEGILIKRINGCAHSNSVVECVAKQLTICQQEVNEYKNVIDRKMIESKNKADQYETDLKSCVSNADQNAMHSLNIVLGKLHNCMGRE